MEYYLFFNDENPFGILKVESINIDNAGYQGALLNISMRNRMSNMLFIGRASPSLSQSMVIPSFLFTAIVPLTKPLAAATLPPRQHISGPGDYSILVLN